MEKTNRNKILIAIAVFGIMAVTANLNNVVYASRQQVLDNVTCYNCTLDNGTFVNTSVNVNQSQLDLKLNKSGDTTTLLTFTDSSAKFPGLLSNHPLCLNVGKFIVDYGCADITKMNATEDIYLESNYTVTGKLFNTNYYNTNKFPIYIELNISATGNSLNLVTIVLMKNDTNVKSCQQGVIGLNGYMCMISSIIPGNSRYNITRIIAGTGSATINSWIENNLTIQ